MEMHTCDIIALKSEIDEMHIEGHHTVKMQSAEWKSGMTQLFVQTLYHAHSVRKPQFAKN